MYNKGCEGIFVKDKIYNLHCKPKLITNCLFVVFSYNDILLSLWTQKCQLPEIYNFDLIYVAQWMLKWHPEFWLSYILFESEM